MSQHKAKFHAPGAVSVLPMPVPAPVATAGRPDFIPSNMTGWVGCAGFVLGVIWLNVFKPDLHRYWEGLIMLAFTSVPMMVFDGVLLWRRAGGEPVDGMTKVRAYSAGRTAVKLAGLVGSVAMLWLLYWVFPEYSASLNPDDGFYNNFFALCWRAGPWALGVSAVYFFFVDARLAEPRDGYWNFGKVVMGDWEGVDWAKVRNHLRTWAVKGFFMPLMFTFLCNNLPGLHWHGHHGDALQQFLEGGPSAAAGFQTLHHWAHNFLFSIDLAFVACGYVLTLRLVQSHVRSAEPTALGWTAALICYQPFWTMFGNLYLGYWSDGNWESKLGAGSGLFYACGFGILFFEVIFVWATIAFGLRFSNLTHRGIVRGGPYYFTKHPAYISKLCAFFLISLPWIDGRGGPQGLRNMCMLAGLSLVYWLRAKTEERHLASIDPAYAMYAEEIRQRHRRWLRLEFGGPRG